jgi:hypothetical protein
VRDRGKWRPYQASTEGARPCPKRHRSRGLRWLRGLPPPTSSARLKSHTRRSGLPTNDVSQRTRTTGAAGTISTSTDLHIGVREMAASNAGVQQLRGATRPISHPVRRRRHFGISFLALSVMFCGVLLPGSILAPAGAQVHSAAEHPARGNPGCNDPPGSCVIQPNGCPKAGPVQRRRGSTACQSQGSS